MGDLAIFLVNHDMTVQQLKRLGPDHNLTLPGSVIEMFMGSLASPTAVGQGLQKLIRGRKPNRGRPGAQLEGRSADPAAVEKKIGRQLRDETLSYLMYPDVFLKFARNLQNWGRCGCASTPQFYYGMERGADITVELEPGKTLAIKFQTVGDPHPDGTRTVFFELNGQPREVSIRDRWEVKQPTRVKADPAKLGDRRADSRSGLLDRRRAESAA